MNSSLEDSLEWQSPVFASPFQFPLGGVVSVHFPAPATLPQADGAYGFELAGGEAGGDLLFGSLIGLDSEAAVLEISGMGRLNVDRTIIRRMFRRTVAGEELFVGPTGLNGWKTSGEAETSGVKMPGIDDCGQTGCSPLRRDFGFPTRFAWNSSCRGRRVPILNWRLVSATIPNRLRARSASKFGKVKLLFSARPSAKPMLSACRALRERQAAFTCKRSWIRNSGGCWFFRPTENPWPI